LLGSVNDWDETKRRINGRIFMVVIIHKGNEKAGFHMRVSEDSQGGMGSG
jgi:hypothetical protein